MKKILYVLVLLFIFYSRLFSQTVNAASQAASMKSNPAVLVIAGVLLVLWLGLVVFYLVWAIHKYNDNYGLSDKEWGVLYPEIYGSAKEKNNLKEKDNLKEKRKNIIDRKQEALQKEALKQGYGYGNVETVTQPFEEPKENPYKCDSFGLPPNTIRGIIALTALFLFVLMEGVNFFGGVKFEENFSELTTALQMIIAFYFGSRAVEVFAEKTRAGKEEKKAEGKDKLKPEELPKSEVKVPASETTMAKAEAELVNGQETTEESILPEEKTSFRIISAVENSKAVKIPENVLERFKNGKGIQQRPLNERILALTGSFETSRSFPECFGSLTNNFDGQGISYGVLQWNIGQKSLQPLLKRMNDNHPDICKLVFGSLYSDFSRMLNLTLSEQLVWARSIQFTKNKNGKIYYSIDPKWIKAFMDLGLREEMISIQADAAGLCYQKALDLANEFELTTERGAALMFDIVTQNGSIGLKTGNIIKEDYMKISPGISDDDEQVVKMEIVARRRSAVCKAQYVQDVLNRKLTIAQGTGKVHMKNYNLKDEFNITLAPIVKEKPEMMRVLV